MQRVILLLMVLMMALTACGLPQPAPSGGTPQVTALPGVTPPPGSGEAVTITFGIWEYERALYQSLVERFAAEHPGINVVLVPLEDAMMGMSGDGPSSQVDALRRIVSIADTAPAFALVPEAFGTPLLLDLKPLMEADATFARDDFYSGALERYSARGGIWALPRYHYLQLLSYNREVFERAGIPEPQPGWTWADVMATAERLTERNGLTVVTHGLMEPSGGFLPLLALLEAEGIRLLSTPALETDITEPAYVNAIEQIRAWRRDGVLIEPAVFHSVPTGGNDNPPADPTDLVREGRVALWGELYLNNPDGTPWKPDFPVGRVPYPVSKDSSILFGGGSEGFIISGGTAHPDAAWRWIEWLSRQPIDQQNGDSPGRIPARQSLATQSGFWEQLDTQTAEAYRWTMANGAPLPERQPDYSLAGALSQALATVMSDPKADVRAALAEAQRQMRDAIEQMALTPTPKPDLNPVIVATPEPQMAPDGATTITFGLFGYNPTEVRRIARAFRAIRPDIFVELKNVEPSPGTFMTSAAELAQQYDCFSWNGPLQESDYAALLDLRPLFEADADFPRDDVLPAALAYYTREGRIYGMPYAVNMRNLVYNRSAFDAAGLQAPGAAWTPADFLAAAQALTKGDGNQRQWGYVPLGGAQADLLFFIGQQDARLTTGSGKDLRPNYTDPKTVAAIRWYLDLSMVHRVMPPLNIGYRRDDPGSDQSYELIQSGRAGMWFDYGATFVGGAPVSDLVPPNQEAPPIEVGVAPLPVGGAGARGSDLYVRGLLISATARQPQACWEWIKYFSTDTTLVYGDLPARRSVARSDAFLNQQPPERLEALTALSETLANPGEPGDDPNALYGFYSDPYWLFKAISETAQKGASLEQGLAEAQRLATAFAECLNREGTRPAACAREVDPTYMGFNVDDVEGAPLPAGMVR